MHTHFTLIKIYEKNKSLKNNLEIVSLWFVLVFFIFFFSFIPSFTCIIRKKTTLKFCIYKLIQDKFKD